MESVLLRRILELHPIRVTADEIVRDLAGEDPDFATRDSIERAIRELTGAEDDFAAREGIERAIDELTRSGLLHPVADGFVAPTRPAVRIGVLLGGLA
jgi:hypothetical protein